MKIFREMSTMEERMEHGTKAKEEAAEPGLSIHSSLLSTTEKKLQRGTKRGTRDRKSTKARGSLHTSEIFFYKFYSLLSLSGVLSSAKVESLVIPS